MKQKDDDVLPSVKRHVASVIFGLFVAWALMGCTSALSPNREAQLRALPIYLDREASSVQGLNLWRWSKIFAGRLGSPATLTLLEESAEVLKPAPETEYIPGNQMRPTATYHVKVALEVNGAVHILEASSSSTGSSVTSITVEQAALSIARKAEEYLIGHGLIAQ